MDAIDREIMNHLRSNARMPVSEIARRVGLSGAPVSRRIERLESAGVIQGYVAIVNEAAAGGLDAFTEIRLTGDTDTREIEAIARQVPEVQQYYTIAGDPDALVRFRVRNVEHLQQVVNAIRRTGIVAGTKTLIVMSAWDRTTTPTRDG
ncbi:Lrp/AsnC family transcriptional regulator, leucine-responsive regulatory protein [Actinomadura madurae]|uniref:Lrp/AsnC family transcriptional regulator, leucine-responsive regulatory protein n=1 Tax=Actinomadura madurae TaxID=1993 RepID=A0A1I5TKW2_9ACTN|nr:Lrp/AsnC family transcriptional regulator [Actinomadura madurae]SFP83663.1 Lrp/AsnC family transcriptional regulator, leucine-responsive regulatory protein [Actinomadura madurae]